MAYDGIVERPRPDKIRNRRLSGPGQKLTNRLVSGACHVFWLELVHGAVVKLPGRRTRGRYVSRAAKVTTLIAKFYLLGSFQGVHCS